MPNTTNFNWATPADTDLVKDGASAIRTLGNSIDTSFVDLKGGTTGQVLSKTSNTDLDFTWVAQDDSNAIQNAIVDAKGDLISATANDTPARLASSAVNGEVLTVDTSTATGLKWAALPPSSPASASATVATSQTRASESYGDLSTTGPEVTLTTGTKALVIVTALMGNTTENGPIGFMSYAVSGATSISASDTVATQSRIVTGSSTMVNRQSAASRLSTLNAGSNTFTAKYRTSGSQVGFSNREIIVIDLGS
jgi:hypothetical protein